MRNFLTTQDWSKQELEQMISLAGDLESKSVGTPLAGKSIALLFLNPSLRTRASFEIGMQKLGGIAVVIQPGKDAWGIEFKPGEVMLGEAEEHIAEVAGVLSSYCDLIAVRAFPKFVDWQVDRQDSVIGGLASYATVPVINMETIVHPCQELALMKTLKERVGDVAKKKLLLTWTWHPRPLNTAVANSAILIATKFGMGVTVLMPEEAYRLDEKFEGAAKENAKQSGGSYHTTTNIDEGYADADVVYGKSWGSLQHYGNPEQEFELRKKYRHFIVNEEKMAKTNNAIFSHCLPLRRNVKATDSVMDSPQCAAIREAENRLYVQQAIMLKLLGKHDALGGA